MHGPEPPASIIAPPLTDRASGPSKCLDLNLLDLAPASLAEFDHLRRGSPWRVRQQSDAHACWFRLQRISDAITDPCSPLERGPA